MENYSYNSYPDSGNSSPRSREIDFENTPPWEDQPQNPNYKAKFMCSYGGKIHPRPHDNQLAYIGGETKIFAVDRSIKFSSMIAKLSALCGGDGEVSFKYQLPGEDLDALISVTNDDDLEHMMHEYDRLFRATAKPARMRLFVFPTGSSHPSFGSEGDKSDRDRFVEALNSGPTHGTEKNAAIRQNNVDFLFGLEKRIAVPSPVKIHDPIPEPAVPPQPPIPEAVGSDHVLNPIEIQRQLQELQRLQLRDQEQQQQLAAYRKKSEDNPSMPYSGEYYAQKIPEKSTPVNVPVTLQQPVSAPNGYWTEKQIPGAGFQATVTTMPGPGLTAEHPVYMMAPGTVYHPPAQVSAPQPVPAPAATTAAPPQMVRQLAGQAAPAGYYANVQRMPPELYREQPVYNMVAPASQQPQHQPAMAGIQQQVVPQQILRSSGGATEAGYAHMAAYDGQVYYAAPAGGGVVVPPQYQGVGVAVSGEMRTSADGKLVGVPKVSQASV